MAYELNPFTRKLDKVGTGGGVGGGIAASLSGNTAGVMAVVSTGTMYLAGGNNVTLSQNANSITISGGAAGGADGINAFVVNGGASTASTTLALSNSNNVTFGLNAGTITASASFNQTAQTQNLHNVSLSGNTAGVMAQISSGTMTLAGGNNVTLSQNGNAVTISGPNTVAQTQFVLSNSNGVSFGTNGSTVTATVRTDYQSSNANYLTSQSNQAFSAGGGSSTFQTLNFRDVNGISFSNSNGSVQASYTVPTLTNSSLTMQAGASTLSSVSRVAFGDGNGVSFGASTSNNGSITITASHNGLTSQSNQNITAANGGFAFQTLSFSNANNFSFGTSAGSAITGSYTVPTVTQYFSATNTTFNGANVSGSLTLNTNGLQVSLSAAAPGGGAAVTVSASNGSFTVGNLNFSNANNVTFGTSAGSIVTASVAAPGAAAENNWVNLLGANTAGNTTASGSTIGVSGINLTLSGTNGSVYNISAPATSSLSATGQVSLSTNGSTISIGVPNAVTLSRYNEFKESPKVAGQIGQASLHIQPWLVPNLHMDRIVQHVAFSNASNSSFSFTQSNWVGIYTRNGSTLSLLHSTSASTNFSGSGTAGSYSLYGGAGYKGLTIGLTQTLTEGMYWIGVLSRTTTGGGAGHTLNQMLNSNVNSSYSGIIGAGSNATNQISLGMGVYTASTSAMPGSIGFTQINGNSSVFLRPPSIYFVSGTI